MLCYNISLISRVSIYVKDYFCLFPAKGSDLNRQILTYIMLSFGLFSANWACALGRTNLWEVLPYSIFSPDQAPRLRYIKRTALQALLMAGLLTCE